MFYKYLVIILIIIAGLSYINIGKYVTEGFEDQNYTEISNTQTFNKHLYDTTATILEEQTWEYPTPGGAGGAGATKDAKKSEDYAITLDDLQKFMVNSASDAVSGQPVDIKNCIGVWDKEWSSCDKQCGGGKQKKFYKILSPAGPGGMPCGYKDGDSIDQDCNMLPCPIDCEGKWSDWSECDQDCFNSDVGGNYGQTEREFTITTVAKDGYINDKFKQAIPCSYGDDIIDDGKIQKQECNTEPCSIPCKGSYAGFKNDCSESCGGGERENIYNITRYPVSGWFRGVREEGAACLEHKKMSCNNEPCPK